MSRFLSTNHTKAWNSSNGSPDAICFTVDRNGISLAGVGIYGGLGTFEYELELLQYVRVRQFNYLIFCYFSFNRRHLFIYIPNIEILVAGECVCFGEFCELLKNKTV